MGQKINLDETMKKDEEKYGLGSNSESEYFNIAEGSENVIRILQPAVSYATYFNNATKRSTVVYGFENGDPIRDENGDYPSSFAIRYAQYVLDRSDNKVKLATLPYTVQNGIRMLQQNPDYSFDEVPMPYDIRITYDKNASPANKYKVSAVPRHEEVPEEALKQLEEKMAELTPEQFVEKMKEKQKKKDQEAGTWRTPEQVQEELKQKGLDTESMKQAAGSEKSTYPDEEINPDDIPF